MSALASNCAPIARRACSRSRPLPANRPSETQATLGRVFSKPFIWLSLESSAQLPPDPPLDRHMTQAVSQFIFAGIGIFGFPGFFAFPLRQRSVSSATHFAPKNIPEVKPLRCLSFSPRVALSSKKKIVVFFVGRRTHLYPAAGRSRIPHHARARVAFRAKRRESLDDSPSSSCRSRHSNSREASLARRYCKN